jgi:hypothetical protein
MSRRSDQARAAVACGVLLGMLEVLSIGAATRWPTVDDPVPGWQRAKPDAATARSSERADEDADGGETQASLLLGQQVLARVDGVLDAARLDVARPLWYGAPSPYDRFCPRTRGCD